MHDEFLPLGINLTGGGARGSYQAGVLLALGEILDEAGFWRDGGKIPFWSGVSAGSINSAYCAAGLNDFRTSTKKLADIWANLTPDRIYRTDVLSMAKNSSRWIRDLTVGSFFKNRLARSLLDTAPLKDLLLDVDYKNIERMQDSGDLKALACSAYSFRENKTVTYLQTREKIAWDKPKRYSKNVRISPEHIMASCAIPLLFPAYKINGEFFADGAFRNSTPLSPLIFMGAKKILLVGVRGKDELIGRRSDTGDPSIAKISGSILNALFFDTIEIDVERIGRVNEILDAVRKDVTTERSEYTKIEIKVIRPSEDVSKIAEEKSAGGFPKTIEFMLGGLGSRTETAELASYILFEPSFTRYMIDLGYKDVKEKKHELLEWFCSALSCAV